MSKSTSPATPAAAFAAASAAAPEMFARDAMIGWFRGEFAAANAIIDALCHHVVEIAGGGGPEYGAAFTAIHRRRMNWIPVIQMQKFCSIADVAVELRRVAELKSGGNSSGSMVGSGDDSSSSSKDLDQKVHPEDLDAGCQGEQNDCWEGDKICLDHKECASRQDRINTRKGFVAREPVKGLLVNVVKGLKVYEDIFTGSELLKLSEFINDLRLKGHRGELSGGTLIYFNKQMKGNKREIIQLGVPLFQAANKDSTSNIESIPPILETVIDHLVQWRLLPDGRRPNGCIINFFDADEYSQPYFKPPHIDNPISTLFLSETTLAFGRILASDPNGNYKGSLMLSLKEGSLLVIRGNSADKARHVICSSPNRRVGITFVRVRHTNNEVDQPATPTQTTAMTPWQPGTSQPQTLPSPVAIACGPQLAAPSWGLALNAPFVRFFPPGPTVVSQGPGNGTARGGTGVFLPWMVGPKKYTKHLPPRIQKRRLQSLPSPIEAR